MPRTIALVKSPGGRDKAGREERKTTWRDDEIPEVRKWTRTARPDHKTRRRCEGTKTGEQQSGRKGPDDEGAGTLKILGVEGARAGGRRERFVVMPGYCMRTFETRPQGSSNTIHWATSRHNFAGLMGNRSHKWGFGYRYFQLGFNSKTIKWSPAKTAAMNSDKSSHPSLSEMHKYLKATPCGLTPLKLSTHSSSFLSL